MLERRLSPPDRGLPKRVLALYGDEPVCPPRPRSRVV